MPILAFVLFADPQMDMPEVNKTGKKYLFPDSCSFGGNTWNAKKLKTIECSLPLKNYPMECPSCSKPFSRFDMKNHFTISHPQEVIPEVAMIPEEEQNLIKKKKSFRKNALKKEDLARLVDKELVLLPFTDFEHHLFAQKQRDIDSFWQ